MLRAICVRLDRFQWGNRCISHLNRLGSQAVSSEEKLPPMNPPWISMTNGESDLVSPAWHQDVLRQTAERYERREEQPVDWETAKLAHALKSRGLQVWYDEFSLKLGDSLRRSIDRGLAECSANA